MFRVLFSDFPLRILPLVFIVLLTALLTSPLWQQEGIPQTVDAHYHLHRSAAVQRAFEQGVSWPRWFPSSSHGRGEPTFHYYSPALYWLVGAVHWTGIGLDQALTMVVSMAFILSGCSIYAWLRHTFSTTASLASTAIYLGMPHIYSRTFLASGDYPQLLAILILPVCLWAFTSLYLQMRVGYWLVAVLSLTGLLLGQPQLALTGTSALLLYCLLLAAFYRRLDGLARCAVAALLAALLSARYWLPALGDLPLVQFQDHLQAQQFHSIQMLSWATLLSVQPFIWDFRAGNPLSPPYNTFGVAQWLTAAAGFAGVLFRPRDKNRLIWCVVGTLFSLVILMFTVSSSAILWKTIPGLSSLQAPYRLLPVAVLGVLPAAAAAVDVWPKHLRWFSSAIVLLVAVVLPFPYLFPALASHTTVVSTESISAEESQKQGIGVEDFLPRDADRDITLGYKPEPEATKLSWRSPHEAVVDLSGQAEPMLLRMHFYPAWSAGNRARLTSGPAGWAQVTDLRDPELPLVIRWEGTAWQHRGERLSLLGLLGLLTCLAGSLYLAWQRKRRHQTQSGMIRERQEEILPTSHNRVGLWTLVGIIFSLVIVRYALSWSNSFPFLYNSPPGQLAFATEGQPTTVGDATSHQLTLLGWELLSGTTPIPGDVIVVRLYWQPHEQINDSLNSFVHLYASTLQRSWAVENRGVVRPPTEAWGADKYYVETMQLKVPDDVPPITYDLVAGLVTSSGERLAVPGSAHGLLQLRSLTVSPMRKGFFQWNQPSVVARAGSADSLKLQGYDLFAEEGEMALRLFWETTEEVATNWITYVHLHDPHGERIAQFDGPPLAGLKATSEWQPDALYIDRRQISLPMGLSSGEYLFRIGLYDRDSGERLAFLPEVDDQVHFESGQLLVPVTIPFE